MSAHGADGGSGEAAAAVAELRILVHRLADEVAAFRRRAHQSESRVRELETMVDELRAAAEPDATGADGSDVLDPRRLRELTAENAELRQRLEQAAERTRQLLDRARFLRQQQGEVSP